MENIVIWKSGDNFWNVTQGNRCADGLCYEEMIAVVIAISLPEPRPCLQWMKTPEQKKQSEEYFAKLKDHI